MILVLHILVALGSLLAAGLALMSPSKSNLSAAYWLTGATIVSGSFLVVTQPAHLAQTCVTGLVYLSLVGAGIVGARHRLASMS